MAFNFFALFADFDQKTKGPWTKISGGCMPGRGGGGVFRISSDGDDRMGAKIKTRKNS